MGKLVLHFFDITVHVFKSLDQGSGRVLDIMNDHIGKCFVLYDYLLL